MKKVAVMRKCLSDVTSASPDDSVMSPSVAVKPVR